MLVRGVTIRKRAEPTVSGRYNLRTDGLDTLGQPELEVCNLPYPSVRAAARLLDSVITETIDQGNARDLEPEMNLQFALRAIQGRTPLLVAVTLSPARARAGYPPLLRLLDMFEPSELCATVAVATEMIQDAEGRWLSGDPIAAVDELRDAIALIPRPHRVPPPPRTEPAEVRFNWANHLSYLSLAEISAPRDRVEVLRLARDRFDWLPRSLTGEPDD